MKQGEGAMNTINVRLVWLDGRTPSLMQDVDHEVTEIVVRLPDGNHYFRTTDEIALDEYVIFRESKD